jgi:hypothetical protein
MKTRYMAPKNNAGRWYGFTDQKVIQKRVIPPMYQNDIGIGNGCYCFIMTSGHFI